LKVVLRWLVPIVTALAIIGQSVTAWAAAGTFGASECCCPDPDTCKCLDHGDSPDHAELRRCSGDAQLVAPAPLVAIPPVAPAPACDVRIARAAPPPLPAPRADRAEPPEPPPF
jgi:hypothetical protein